MVLAGNSQDYQKVTLPENYSAKIDLIYIEHGHWKGKMDFYFPIDREEAAPVLINIHGGGWNHGVKESQRGFGSFFKRGMAVANVEYRLESQAKAPAAVEDIRSSISYLISNAGELNIDVDKIIVMGASAGGHLALMAGLSQNNTLFGRNNDGRDPVGIFAVIDKYGITDLIPLMSGSSVKKWLGPNSDDLDFARSMSPISLVDGSSPPVFIVHGDTDPIVPYTQSQVLFDKLQSFNVKSRFITVKGGGHGKFQESDKKWVNQEIHNFLEELGL